MSYTPFPKVSFQAKLREGKTVKVAFAQFNEKVLAAFYYITIDAANPVLFDIRKAAENKEALEKELLEQKDKRFRTGIVKRVLADVSTDFILRNKTEQAA